MNKVQPTGYWTFFCNPKEWAIDDFLRSGITEDTFRITRWQKEWFKLGQLGIIRVGHDKRTKNQLNGKKKLERGIYAFVEVIGEVSYSASKGEYWLEEEKNYKTDYSVPIRYIKNLLDEPILIEELDELVEEEIDPYLLNGYQASSMPLSSSTFEALSRDRFTLDSKKLLHKTIDELEQQYGNSNIIVKEQVSKYIERGPLAKKYKELANYKCQICEAQDLDSTGFTMPNGKPYIETHHIIPVANQEKGSLGINNLIAVCPNHHRQLHYGNVEIIENTKEKIIFNIDGIITEIKKISYNF